MAAKNPIQPRPGELREELQLRRATAQLKLVQTRAQLKLTRQAIKAALGTHAAADTGRRNRDWKASPSSADLANIPDSTTIIPRARQLVRDTWVARSIVRAFARNVVGREIRVNPHAKDRDGKPLDAFNRRAKAVHTRWAKSKLSDVERRQTFGQKQRLAAKERVTVGEHLWIWSYRMPIGFDGRIDRNKPVGFQLQSFEPEQFDLRILSYEGREVRGGVEVDQNNAPIAIHIYTRNPNDVLYRHAFFSERIDISRCFHYFEGERVLQTRGQTPLTCVMQDVRDVDRGKGAHLTRWLMEACIGAIIKTMSPVTGTQGLQSTIAPAPNDPDQTTSGMTEADFVPGMVANLQPGEDIVPFVPTSPGGQYEPFMSFTIRGIGAGVGMSGGQVMRQATGNYSAARQDMLEDRKEWEPEQDLIIDDMIRPAYEKVIDFAVLEGRFDDVEGFDADEYMAERHRFLEADFIPPPQTWIDPQREAAAMAILLANRLITREEIVALRGGEYYATVEKLAQETKFTEQELGLTLPENEKDRQAIRDLIKTMLGNRLGTLDNVMSNSMDLEDLLTQGHIKSRKDYVPPLLPVAAPQGSMVNGNPVKNSAGEVIGGGVTQPPPGASIVKPSNGANGHAVPANGIPKPAAGVLAMLSADGYEFSSTQINLPTDLSQKVLAMAHEIPDEDLAEEGREITPHCTVKYGLQTADADRVRSLLGGVGPVRFCLGKTAVFEGKDADVVILDVSSPDLVRLNRKVAELPHVDTYPDYRPHVTIAYVKPGLGKKYAGISDLDGEQGTVDRLRFSAKNGAATDIQLRGKPDGGRLTKLNATELDPRATPQIVINQEQALREATGNAWPQPHGLAVVPSIVPDYRDAKDSSVSCATCSYAVAERCSQFNFVTQREKLCDAWAAKTVTEMIGVPNTAKAFPPGPQPGQVDLESRFFPKADPLAPYPDQSGT